MPPTKVGHVFGSTMEYSMAVFAGDLAAANAWNGDGSLMFEKTYKASATLQLAERAACVLDIGGSAHVAFAFRDGDTLFFVELPDEEPDLEAATVKRASMLASDPGELLEVSRIDVPSGVLVVGDVWKDFEGEVEPPKGAVKSLDDEALVIRVTPGSYAITRRTIAEGEPGIVQIAPVR